MRSYYRLTCTLSPDREAEFSAVLWSLDPVGLEIDANDHDTRIDAYFVDSAPEGLETILAPWQSEVSWRRPVAVPETDWLNTYRSVARPLAVGRRWLVDPREPGSRVAPSKGRMILRIPARRAFGTGSHESTRLILEWLEDLDLLGARVLDVGTGSAILALAAQTVGASAVVGLDVDLTAVFVAADNRRLNRGSFELVAGDLSCLHGRCFDAVLVNILPREWIGSVRRLVAVLAVGAEVVISGVPLEDRDEFRHELEGAGLVFQSERTLGDWVALRAVWSG